MGKSDEQTNQTLTIETLTTCKPLFFQISSFQNFQLSFILNETQRVTKEHAEACPTGSLWLEGL